MCGDTIEFKAYTTYSNSKEFSQVRHPRNDEYDTNCGRNELVGRENNSKHYIFWPYTQFKQDTLKSIRTTLDVGTTVINIIGGPSKDNPVSVSPNDIKPIELEVEVLSRSGNKVSGLTSSNFLVSLEKNNDGRSVAIAFSYNDVTKKISFSSLNIPYANIGCGTYEIRVDYMVNQETVRSSYSQDNALIVSNIGETVQIENVTFPSGTTSEYVATKSITLGPGITIEKGAEVTFKAPTVKLQSGFHAEEGSVVNIRQE